MVRRLGNYKKNCRSYHNRIELWQCEAMNIVLQNKDDDDYYIATIKRVDGIFIAFGKRI